jgi:hypothetical protein
VHLGARGRMFVGLRGHMKEAALCQQPGSPAEWHPAGQITVTEAYCVFCSSDMRDLCKLLLAFALAQANL